MNDIISVQLAISKLHMQSMLEQPPSESIAMRALAELNTTLAELEATNDELNKQNEALAQATSAAEVESNRYRELFERVPVPFIVTDAWGVIEEVNAAAEGLLRVDRDTLRGKPISVFVPPAERRDFRNRINHGSPEPGWEAVFQPRRGDRITVQIDVATLPSADHSARLGWVIQNLTPARAAASAERMLHRETTLRIEAQAAITRLRALNVGLQTLAHDVEMPIEHRVRSLLEALVPRSAQEITCFLPSDPDKPVTVGEALGRNTTLQTMIIAPHREPGRLVARRVGQFVSEDAAILQAAANAVSLLLYTTSR